MQKVLKLFCLFFVCSIAAKPWDVDIRCGFGPAWHNFFSAESYKLTQRALEKFSGNEQIITTQYKLMPFTQAHMRLFLKDLFSIKIGAAGGESHNGSVDLSYILYAEFSPTGADLEIARVAKLGTTIKIGDFEFGLYGANCEKTIFASVLGGYVTNRENLQFNFTPAKICFYMNNRWRGPYIGVGVGGMPLERCWFNLSYKAVFASLFSGFRLFFPNGYFASLQESQELLDPNGSYSARCSAALGSLFSGEWLYQVSDYWLIGTNIQYLQYRNHKRATVTLVPGPVVQELGGLLAESASLKKIRWQQIMWTFFAQFTF